MSEVDVDKLLENKDLNEMLEFETQIFLDILHKDALVVVAKGLNLDAVLINLFKVYSDPGNLVLVLNCNELEENYFIEKLGTPDVHTRITSSMNATEREEIYLSGGVHFNTTRILVVDMLRNRIPIEKITGIVVLRAHSVLESCQEAFVLRLFRQKNKTGFVKAFSSSAQSFTIGFGHIERVMRALFVKELCIYPRFHALVIQSFKEKQPQVIELHIPLSSTMSKIQCCILDLMNLTVKELKRLNKTIEFQEITIDNCLTKQFHKILETQLDCVWHQLSSKSKQLITELKTLRFLILTMLHANPVTCYHVISKFRTLEYAQTSSWVLLEPAELLFTYANSLVFSGDKEFNPEVCPKWNALSEILRIEIPAEFKKVNRPGHNKVLILCQDYKICYQLNNFLIYGPKRCLFNLALTHGIPFKSVNKDFENFQKLTENTQPSDAKKLKTNEQVPEASLLIPDTEDLTSDESQFFKNSYCLKMSQTILEHDADNKTDTEYLFEPFTQMENMDLTELCEKAEEDMIPEICIRTFKHSDSFLELQTALEEMQPNFVIMYHSNMAAIRNIELYAARRCHDVPLKIYFLIHAATVEEQSYLTTLRREKEAFEFLIQSKSTMVIPEDQDGKSNECIALQRDLTVPDVSTRHGGKVDTDSNKQLIIVDMREFRSELPALIHKRGIEIEPVTISVGDYILTPEICIERKSLSDLIGSLNSGRLYQQCTQMLRYYTKAMLLIEFDQHKPFCWKQSNYMISDGSDSFHIQQKLLLLTLHFPKLKIVWSVSPYASAQLFEELKAGKEQPNIQYAASLGNDQDLDIIETKYNTGIYDFVQKLPGINSKNINQFLRQTKNLTDAIKMSQEELKNILGNSKDAELLHSILHQEHSNKEHSEKGKYNKGPREKFKHFKKLDSK